MDIVSPSSWRCLHVHASRPPPSSAPPSRADASHSPQLDQQRSRACRYRYPYRHRTGERRTMQPWCGSSTISASTIIPVSLRHLGIGRSYRFMSSITGSSLVTPLSLSISCYFCINFDLYHAMWNNRNRISQFSWLHQFFSFSNELDYETMRNGWCDLSFGK